MYVTFPGDVVAIGRESALPPAPHIHAQLNPLVSKPIWNRTSSSVLHTCCSRGLDKGRIAELRPICYIDPRR